MRGSTSGLTINIAELEYDIPLSPVLMTTKEYEMNRKLKSSFIENIEKEGIVIYDAHR